MLADDIYGGIVCAEPVSGMAQAITVVVEDFLFLLPNGRPRRRFTGVVEVDAIVGIFALFLLPRGRPQPLFSTTTGASSRLIVTASDMLADELVPVREINKKISTRKEEDDAATVIKQRRDRVKK
jgi:hypothetical protein